VDPGLREVEQPGTFVNLSVRQVDARQQQQVSHFGVSSVFRLMVHHSFGEHRAGSSQ
jgi:hypothetical protein